jgi:hypothetical protein
MARGGDGLHKVSPEPAMPYPSMPSGQATPETAVFYPLGHPTPYAYVYIFRQRTGHFTHSLRVLVG